MANLNGTTKVMINRCIELLTAKIAQAQTRHIAQRPSFRPLASSKTPGVKELLKQENNKSTNEQTDSDSKEPEERLDDIYYKHKNIFARKYTRTWSSFPKFIPKCTQRSFETSYPKSRNIYRREPSERPKTAEPWDAEAKFFIRQWDSNQAMINRNRYVKSVDFCPPPTFAKSKNSIYQRQRRAQQFYY